MGLGRRLPHRLRDRGFAAFNPGPTSGLKAAFAFTDLARRLDDPGFMDPTTLGRLAALAFLRAEALSGLSGGGVRGGEGPPHHPDDGCGGVVGAGVGAGRLHH